MTDLRPADPARDACLFLLASFAEPLCAPFLERAVRHLGPDTLRSDPGRVDGALATLFRSCQIESPCREFRL